MHFTVSDFFVCLRQSSGAVIHRNCKGNLSEPLFILPIMGGSRDFPHSFPLFLLRTEQLYWWLCVTNKCDRDGNRVSAVTKANDRERESAVFKRGSMKVRKVKETWNTILRLLQCDSNVNKVVKVSLGCTVDSDIGNIIQHPFWCGVTVAFDYIAFVVVINDVTTSTTAARKLSRSFSGYCYWKCCQVALLYSRQFWAGFLYLFVFSAWLYQRTFAVIMSVFSFCVASLWLFLSTICDSVIPINARLANSTTLMQLFNHSFV